MKKHHRLRKLGEVGCRLSVTGESVQTKCLHRPAVRGTARCGGSGTVRLRLVVRVLSLPYAIFKPDAPRSRPSKSLADAEVHLVSLSPAFEDLLMPSKLYGIMATRRPGVFLGRPQGAVARLLAAHDAGITIDVRRPETYGEAVCRVLADPARLNAKGANARRAFAASSSAPFAPRARVELLSESGTSEVPRRAA